MKRSIGWALVALCTQLGIAHAGLILIDYDNGTATPDHNAEIHDGGLPGSSSTFWVATGADPIQIADNLNSPAAASAGNNLTIDQTTNPGQDTGHTLALGDQFNASYWWRDAWHWVDNTDRINMVLFYTADDTIGGTRTVLTNFTSAISVANNAYQQETFGLTAALTDQNAVGKKLFVTFSAIATDNHWARIDGVYLEVVPEQPATPTPVITSIDFSGGIVSVTATNLTADTQKYILIWTDDLTGTFTNVVEGSKMTPTNQVGVLQDTNPPPANAFYKVQTTE